MSIEKYLRIVDNMFEDLEDVSIAKKPSINKQESNSRSLSMQYARNPNNHLIQIQNWNTDLKFQSFQMRFLRAFQRKFLNFDIWFPNWHEVCGLG